MFESLNQIGDSAVAVSKRIIRLEADSLIIVIDGALIVAQPVIKSSSVIVGISIIGMETNNFIVMIDSLLDFLFGRKTKIEAVILKIIVLCHLQIDA